MSRDGSRTRSSALLILAALLLALLAAPVAESAPAPTNPTPTPTAYATPTGWAILPDALTITSAADVEARRAALKAHIWPQGYPKFRTYTTYLGVNDPAILSQLDTTNLATVHAYRVEQAYGLNVDLWLYQAKTPAGISLIYHAGHDFTPLNNVLTPLITRLLAAGVDVVVVGMILTPGNPDPVYQGTPIQFHNDPAALPRVNDKHPLHFFLEPSVAAINILKTVYPYRPVHMAGHSGGGWTTTLLAAIDPRIKRSFVIAGSLPFDVFEDGEVSAAWGPIWRDWEQGSPHQGHTDTYQLAAYRDLYVMGGHGAGRSQLLVLNEFDSCCFWSAGRDLSYARSVQKRVLEIGDGQWRQWVDTGQVQHDVSIHTTNEILRELGRPPVAAAP